MKDAESFGQLCASKDRVSAYLERCRQASTADDNARLHAANNALTIAKIALRRISDKDTNADIVNGLQTGPLAEIADEALAAIEKVIR